MKNSKRSISKPRPSSIKSVSSRKPSARSSVQTNANPSPHQKPQRGHRRTVSDSSKLAQLQGKTVEKAPTIYKGQIFRDIYDELGNHDRVLVTLQSVELYEEVNQGSFVTFNNKSDVSTEKFILPDTSYKSFEQTCHHFMDELVMKLDNLQQVVKEKNKKEINPKCDKEILNNFTFQRNRNKPCPGFTFPVIFGFN